MYVWILTKQSMVDIIIADHLIVIIIIISIAILRCKRGYYQLLHDEEQQDLSTYNHRPS